ncbi:MAG TPA: phosphatidylserine decarboxylase [Chondromyces sp.]|nr:phosphatidylserine decarboxylase [Chondromyces sp.]
MKQSIYRLFIELTNKKWSSQLLNKFSRSRLSKPLVGSFARTYRINHQEMEYPMNHYNTLHDFFIRTLKPEVRKIDYGADHVVSPVDALLEDSGTIEPTREFMVKGKRYSIVDMLGTEEKAEKYRGGYFLVLYLSPAHYHRIHSPINGEVINNWTLGEHSYPVNKIGLKFGREPLSKNYRSITELRHNKGYMAVVKVGAMFVNTIVLTYTESNWTQGEEVAYFNFGSTVVLLFEKDTFLMAPHLSTPTEVKVGQKIGRLI